MTLEEIESFLIDHDAHCPDCGCMIRQGDLQAYDHNGGYTIKGRQMKQWIFYHCPQCEYDASLSKVMHDLAFRHGTPQKSFLAEIGEWQERQKQANPSRVEEWLKD